MTLCKRAVAVRAAPGVRSRAGPPGRAAALWAALVF